MRNQSSEVQREENDWLASCHGFRVDSPRSRLGYVEEIRHDPESGRPSALVVRGGMLGGHHVIPVEEIAGVARSERLIVLQRQWPFPETGARPR